MKPILRAGPVAALALLGVAAYAGALRGGAFVFDDLRHIAQNSLIRDLGNYLPGSAGYQAMPNRYVGYLTFALNYRLAGLDVAAFRAVNVAVHVANALLVYALVVLTFYTPRVRGSALAPSARAIAFVAAALFVAHPLQTEAVTYVVQRFTSLATLFYLAAVVLYVRWRLAGEGARGRPALRALGYVPIVLAALLAMKTKEIAFTLPFAIALYEVTFLAGPPGARLAVLAPVLATAAVIPLTLLTAPGLPELGNTVATGQGALSPLQYLVTQITVVPQYLRLLLLPLGQNADPDHPVHRSVADPAVLASLALLLAIAGFATWLQWRAARGRIDPAARLVAFGIAWFFLALAVESSLIPLADVMAERRVYLPSVGFFAATSTAAALAWRRAAAGRFGWPFVAAGAALALLLAFATSVRNEVWRDELTLWTDAAARSPRKPRTRLNLGVTYYEHGRVDDAIAELRAAVALDPGYADAHTNLGVAYLQKGLRAEARREMLRGVELRAASTRR